MFQVQVGKTVLKTAGEDVDQLAEEVDREDVDEVKDVESEGESDTSLNSGLGRKGRKETASRKETVKRPNLGIAAKSRQAIAGEKIKRKNQEDMKRKLEGALAEVRMIKQENTKLSKEKEDEGIKRELAEKKLERKSMEMAKQLETKDEQDKWLKYVYRHMSGPARRNFKQSVDYNKGLFVPGTLSRLRRATGVNFSQVPQEEKQKLTNLATKVQEFALSHSSEKPDMKAHQSGLNKKSTAPAMRTCNHHLTVLHSLFCIEHPDFKCSYSAFTLYWPSFVSKPNLNEFTSCHCEICENSGMKMEVLVKLKVVPDSMEIFAALKLEEEGDPEVLQELFKALEDVSMGPRKEEIVTWVAWEKVTKEVSKEQEEFDEQNGAKRKGKKEPQKRLKSTKLSTLIDLSLKEFKILKDHLHRHRVIQTEIRKRREDVLNDPTGKSCQIYLDWSDGLVLRQVRDTQGAFFASSGISLQTGYLYHNIRSFGFGSFCEGSDHKVCILFDVSLCVCLLIFLCMNKNLPQT